MEGYWADDMAWVWHHFYSSSYEELTQPFRWLRHLLSGLMLSAYLSLMDIFGLHVFKIWCIMRLLIFTANGILVYIIARYLFRPESILPLAISFAYIVSPLVNDLSLVTFNYHVFVFFCLLSYWFSIKSVTAESSNGLFLALAMVSIVIPMVSLESTIILDGVRPIIFMVIFMKNNGYRFGKALKKSLISWVPFLLIGTAVVVDTILRPQYGPYAGLYSSWSLDVVLLKTIFIRYIRSFEYALYGIYELTVRFALLERLSFVNIVFALGAAYFSYRYLFHKSMEGEDAERPLNLKEAKWAMAFGFLTLFLGIFIYAVAREHLMYGVNSRHAILASIGASIFLPSMIFYFALKIRLKLKQTKLLFAVLIFLGTLQCNFSILSHDKMWEYQQSIWWQLAWRAPDIQENTLMVIDMPWEESPTGSSYDLPAFINFAYADSKDNLKSHFAMSTLNAFRKQNGFGYYENHKKELHEITIYSGKISYYPQNLLVAQLNPDGLLLFDDEIRGRPWDFKKEVSFLISRATKDRIVYTADNQKFPYRWVLGSEPEHDWRYFFQKATALNEVKNFTGVIELYKRAGGSGVDMKGTRPQYLDPFILAFYLTGELETANELLKMWAESRREKVSGGHLLLEKVKRLQKNSSPAEEMWKEMKRIWPTGTRQNRF